MFVVTFVSVVELKFKGNIKQSYALNNMKIILSVTSQDCYFIFTANKKVRN